jgi:hypothetical protein
MDWWSIMLDEIKQNEELMKELLKELEDNGQEKE